MTTGYNHHRRLQGDAQLRARDDFQRKLIEQTTAEIGPAVQRLQNHKALEEHLEDAAEEFLNGSTDNQHE